MNIVILCDTYYPHINPAANCIERYLPCLKKGNTITIICPATILNKEAVIKDGVRVEFISCMWNDMRSFCREKEEKGTVNGLSRLLYGLVRAWGVFLSFFAFPSRFSWYKKAYYRKLENINKKQSIDVIISISDPVCAHIASMKFKRKYKRVRWISYTTDPISDNPTLYKNIIFKQIRKRRIRNLESQIYNLSDFSILTEELFELAKTMCPESKSKLCCFPYVLSPFPSSHLNNQPIIDKTGDTIILVYAGSLKKGIRTPETLLDIIKRCSDNIQLWLFIAGDCGNIVNQYKSDNIIVNGILPQDQYLSVIGEKADVLINISNSFSLQAPSKMLELLSTGKPIINFSYKKDNFYHMIESYPLGLNIMQGDVSSYQQVENFCKDNKGKRLTFEEVKQLFPHNVLEKQTRILESMLSV